MFEFDVLGPMIVRRAGQPVRLPAGLLQRILVMLLLARGKPVHADTLVDAIWDGRPPRTAKKTMQVYIHRLRSALGGDLPIAHRNAGYVLSIGPEELDAWRFERLVAMAKAAAGSGDALTAWKHYEAAERLWRGEAYADAYDLPQVDAERRRLQDLRLSGFEARMTIGLELGRHHEVVSELRHSVAEHPYREGLCALLMLALYRSGQRAEALEVYRAHYKLLSEELGMQPMPELKRLHEQILHDDPTLHLRRAEEPHRFLPHDVPGFVGRDEDIEWLDTRMAGDSAGPVIITAIAGAGGIGKTALAVRWAHRASRSFPDGQLYVNLRGYDSRQPLQPLEAVTHLLRCLGVAAEKLPVDLDSAAAMFRSMLTGKRVLLLLDNARFPEQVRPLLPADPGNLVLITSRDRLSGLIATEGAKRITLGLLGVEDAIALVKWMIGDVRAEREAESVRRLVEVCGRLPLALRIAATQLTDRPDRSVHDFVDELEAGDRPAILALDDDAHRGLPAVLDQSYHALTAQAQHGFAHLGVFPGHEISAELAAPLIGCSPERALSILDELVGSHLLEQSQPGRYVLHDLVRESAAKVFVHSGASRDEPLTRLCGLLEHMATQAHARIDSQKLRTAPGDEEGLSSEEAMIWLEREKGNLAATAVVAAELGLAREAQAMAKALWMFYYHAGHTADWIATFEAMYEAMVAQGESSTKYYVLNALGSGYVIAGQYEKAMNAHRECISARETLGDADGVARSRSNLAMSYYRLGRYEDALAELKLALAIYQRNDDRAMQAFLLSTNIPDSLNAMGRYDEAIEVINRAMTIMADSHNPFASARALQTLGDVHIHRGRPDLAVKPLEEALSLSRGVNNRRSRR